MFLQIIAEMMPLIKFDTALSLSLISLSLSLSLSLLSLSVRQRGVAQ